MAKREIQHARLAEQTGFNLLEFVITVQIFKKNHNKASHLCRNN